MSPERTTDVLVVGAGPGGMLAADRLAREGVNVVLVDAGRHHTKRICPVDRMKSCNGCHGICNVISGFGGSIHYGDGVKLSRFPSGRRLAELLGPDRAEQLTHQALGQMCGSHQPDFHRALAEVLPFPIKDYPVASLDSAEVRGLIDRLHMRLASSPRVELRLGTEVTVLRPDGRGRFTALLQGDSGREVVAAQRVIMAVGRRGQRWWARQIRTLGLAYSLPVPSVGLRFEMPVGLLRRGALVHDDLKTTMVRAGVKVKTFCFCAGSGGGRLKFTDYGDHTLLDGHVIPEPGTSAMGNFALLAQLRDADGAPHSAQWVEENLLAPYRALREDRPGKPVLQWYPDWREKTLTCTTLDDVTRRAGHRPSLADFRVANLAGILPDQVHRAMRNVFEELMPAVAGRPFTARDASRVAVIGLELESLWDELVLTPHLETSLPGLYAVGDCSGLAQGILQAAVAGIAAAEHAGNASPLRTGGAP